LLVQRKVTKRKDTHLTPNPARLKKSLSFRCDIHVATSLKQTSCLFSNDFFPVLGVLAWAGDQKQKGKSNHKIAGKRFRTAKLPGG
jgi:hypothetical protein